MKKKEKLVEQSSKMKKIAPVKLFDKMSSLKQDSMKLSTMMLSGKPDLGRDGLSWWSTTPPSSSSSSKRNSTATVAGTPKRLKLSDIGGESDGVRGCFEVEGDSGPLAGAAAEALSTGSLTKVSMELLLHAAGLEVQYKCNLKP